VVASSAPVPWRVSLAVFCLVTLPVAFTQASEHCDRYLPVSRQDPFGYRMRGDRCEGVYVQQVASTPLVVASFGRLAIPDVLTANGALLVEWPPVAGEVRLRAHSLKPRTYYRMDHRQKAGARSYRWPTDVLSALKLTRRDIGIVAFMEQKVGSSTREVYLPVRINMPAARGAVYELVLVPGNELREVFVALSRVAADGKRSEVSAAKPLRYGFYPAGRSIRIPVGPIARPGTYLLEIGATLRDGGAVSREVWFVEPTNVR
jgi:hypothetical protein